MRIVYLNYLKDYFADINSSTNLMILVLATGLLCAV